MTYDPTDPESVEQEDTYRSARARFRAESWEWMLADRRGRVVLSEILHSTGFMGSTFRPGSPDVSAYLEGQRSVGLALRARLGYEHTQFLNDIDRQLQELASDGGIGRSGTDE